MLNSSSTAPNKTNTRQKRLEESVLSKAKPYMKADSNSVETPSPTLPESTNDGAGKKRKPRHSSDEGKKLLEARAKARVQLEGFLPVRGGNKRRATAGNQDDNEPLAKKGKKSKSKKKKKKSKGQQERANQPNPGTEERLRREALSYLQLWKSHRDHWKFEKLKQMWLLKHALKDHLIDDKVFIVLLDYMSSIKGTAKAKTLQEMQEFVADFEKKFGRQDGDPNSAFSSIKPKEDPGEELTKEYERAREIMQTLSE